MIGYIKPSVNSLIYGLEIPKWVDNPIDDDAPKITDEIYGYSAVEIPDGINNAKCEDFDLTYGVFIFNNQKYAERIAAENEEEL